MMLDMQDKDQTARAHRQIDENLRRVFQENLEQELPDRLKRLLDELKRADREQARQS